MPRKSWWARLPFGVRMAAGTCAVLTAIGGGAAGLVAALRDGDAPRVITAVGQPSAPAGTDLAAGSGGTGPAATAAGSGSAGTAAGTGSAGAATGTGSAGAAAETGSAATTAGTGPDQIYAAPVPPGPGAAAPRTSAERERTARRNHRGAAPRAQAAGPPAVAAPAGPVITTRTETETREIPFETRRWRDASLPPGTERIDEPGVPGVQTLRYLVTLTDGRPTSRRLIDATVTRQPKPRVVAVNTKKPDRECGQTLHVCVPLGRSAICPELEVPAGIDTGEDALEQLAC